MDAVLKAILSGDFCVRILVQLGFDKFIHDLTGACVDEGADILKTVVIDH